MYKMMWINTGETRKGGEFVGKEQRGLLTKPSEAAPGTRPTAKHMLQGATPPCLALTGAKHAEPGVLEGGVHSQEQ